ncbi:TetR/AcrR family transcriptional regulator [Actinoplanes sp. NPDC051411]|uniref:TetR/AcrR family transcriptional regulator n=1 Tax=Actinoplanes sp. NPDC051411 TaxID=3155522 RepID=UPI0034316D96
MSAHRNLPEADVLARGLTAFAELGYDATSVRELAKRLDVSHNYINDRFTSKAGFWRAVVEAAMRPRMGGLGLLAADDSRTDAERLRDIVTSFYEGVIDLRDVNRIIADESSRDTERLDYLVAEFIGPVFASWRPVLSRLLPGVPPETAFFAITGPALALAHGPLARRLAGAEPAAGRASDLARLVLDGLLPRDAS